MENISPMFTVSLPANSGSLILTLQARHPSQGDATLQFFENCLVQHTSKKKQTIHFDFDLKYSFTASPVTLQFEKQEEKVVYTLRSQADLKACRQILKGKVNQRGFHQQFKPKKKIGKGNFASVYLAQKLQAGRSFAIKAFSKEAAYSEDKGKECLIKQIQIMRALDHKSCMKLHQIFESENSLYIVVELLEGGQLYDKVKAKYKFKPNQTRTILHSILLGLKEMHSKKIMHRDLKPENLLFRSENSWDCVIADFGLSEFADAQEYLFVRCGTPGYVAPEVINIKDMKTKYDPICDIFSLGLIFHILLLGASAFPGKTYNEVLAQNRASNIPLQGEQYKKLDPHTLNLLKKMLKRNPQERITAAEALSHPYFSQFQEEELLGETEVTSPQGHQLKSGSTCDSPLLTSSNPARKQEKLTKKDSCVQFKMGKENVFTGKVETVLQTNSTANSVGKQMQSVAMPKISKFSVKK